MDGQPASIAGAFVRNAERAPQKLCLRFEGEEWTYERLRSRAAAFAAALAARGDGGTGRDGQSVAVVDPLDPAATRYVYLFRQEGGSSFSWKNGAVRMQRDADADRWLDRGSWADSDPEKLGTSNRGYGANLPGTVCDDAGRVLPGLSEDRFPSDAMTVTTPTYRLRATGRWMVRELNIRKPSKLDVPGDGDGLYGADLIDRWKGRAFQQSPDSSISLVGFEDEQVNWEANASLLGWRVGPVRAIREVWGADSGTNVTKTETYYRDADVYRYRVRVHPIPSDGLYTSWDYNADTVSTYYNLLNPDGVPIDGVNDDTGSIDQVPVTGQPAYFDAADPTFDLPSAVQRPEQVAGKGDAGSAVYVFEFTSPTFASNPTAVPYYRDDSCFDDGTGSDPGPHLAKRRTDEGADATWTDAEGTIRPRECWDAARHADDPDYAATVGTRRFWQGSVGTHGLHILLIADSDNAFTTVPLTEINAEQRMVVLPPTEGNVGEQYGRSFEKPLLTTVAPFEGTTTAATHLELSAPAGGAHGDPVTVSATLTRTGGAPVAGRELTFSVGSTSVTATTSDDGSASATLVPTDPPGVTDVVVAFAGGDGDGPSRATASFEITRESTALTALGATRQRSEHRVSAQLVEDDGPPVAGRTVEFEAGGVSTTAVTDPDGVAEAVLRLSGGDRSWTVAFAGDDVYEPSTASATSR